LLAAARSARITDAAGFVEHLQLMLQASPERRPADAMSWSRRLRSLAAARRPGLRSRRAVGSIAALIALAAGIGTAGVIRANDSAGRAETGSEPAAKPAASYPAGARVLGARVGPPPDSPPGSAGLGPPPLAPFAPGGGIQDGPTDAVRSTMAAISTPSNGGTVPVCVPIRGTSRLPAGQTLLLSVENLSVGDGVKHVRPVPGWRRPARLAKWRALALVGRPDDPLADRYRIEVFVVPLAAMQEQMAAAGVETAADALRGDWITAIPAGSRVGASIFVSRSARPRPRLCGPFSRY
jgi:hypothetical protein